jgi:hypothetical protein
LSVSDGRELTLPRQARQERIALDESLCLVHHHPGYLRIRAAAFMGAADASPAVAAATTTASATPGLRAWSHRPQTGSIVIEYEPGALEADDLLSRIATAAGFRGLEVSTHKPLTRQQLVSSFLEGVQTVNDLVTQLTGNRADLRELVPVALAVTSVASFIRGDARGRLPQWANALYHSYRIFMQWHRREIGTKVGGGPLRGERA